MEILSLKEIDEAASVLINEDVLGFPTETVYGVGVVFDSKVAFERLVNLKRRSPDKPFAMMCESLDEAFNYIDVSPKAKKLMNHFLPGELTVLVKAKPELPEWVTLGTGVIGIRVPDSSYVKSLIKKVGKPLLVTSANKSGEPTTKVFEEVVKVFDGELKAIVEGKCESLVPTTIVNLSKDSLSLVREGPIPFDTIKKFWEE
ncbi:MAG: threonylcarbamoyl-AMP synthase [Bacilli bacterium]|nr:threonylcarbamoyl-AMP synthase [Bacilli bacterium]